MVEGVKSKKKKNQKRDLNQPVSKANGEKFVNRVMSEKFMALYIAAFLFILS